MVVHGPCHSSAVRRLPDDDAQATMVPGAAAGPITAIGASPQGTVHALRFGVVSSDPVTGAVHPFGDTLVGYPGGLFDPRDPSVSFALGYLPDSTLVVPDAAQSALIGIAP